MPRPFWPLTCLALGLGVLTARSEGLESAETSFTPVTPLARRKH